MKPKRIILVRHGESEANADWNVHSHTPDHKIALTLKGIAQSIKAGRDIKKILGKQECRFYISPYNRARETYHHLSEDNLVKSPLGVYEDPRIREQDFGNLRSREEAAVLEKERDEFGTFFYRFSNGESGADVYDRVTSFIDTMHRDFEKKDFPPNAIIVTHGLTIRLFLMRWFRWSVEFFEALRNPRNAEYFIMELQADGKYKLVTPLRQGDTEALVTAEVK